MRKVQQETLSKNNFKSAGGIPPCWNPQSLKNKEV